MKGVSDLPIMGEALALDEPASRDNMKTYIPLSDNDYTLVDGAAWFTVKKFSIRIHATDEGVIADIFALGREMDESIASTYAYDSEYEESTLS